MKKFATLIILLFCGAFNSVSAQSVLRWSVHTPDGGATLKIKIDGVVVVNVQQAQYASPQSGVLQVNNDSTIEYEATTSDAPLICAATETDLVAGWISSCFDTNGQFIDPIIYSEFGSWSAHDDFDYTIQLSTLAI